jgi:hypothetical protein
MSYELINTSAPRGLLPGSRGFTTVAMTADTPPPLIQVCDGLSNYTHVFGLESGSYADNPPSFSHFHVRLGSRSLSVLSRVAAHAPDYSGRTNRIAHHFVLDTGGSDRLGAAGPAATLDAIRFLKHWEGEPRELPPASVPVPPGPARMPSAFIAKHWQDVFGSPDLAARLAGAWMAAPNRQTFLIVAPRDPRREQMVGLIGDAINLLPPEMRWGVTFSTYLSIDPPGGDCVCRGLLPDSAAERKARRLPDTLIINFESGTHEGGAYGSDMAKALISAAKGLALPPWAIQAAVPAQAHKVPVARLASSVEKPAVQVSSELRGATTPGRAIHSHDSAQVRPPKRDRTVMIAALVCAAAVAALMVVLSFPTKTKSSGLAKTEVNAPPEQANTNYALPALDSISSTSAVSTTNGHAAHAAANSAVQGQTNDFPDINTARKPEPVKPPTPLAPEKNRRIYYSVQSSLLQTPSDKQEMKAILYSGEVDVFVWKKPNSISGINEWQATSQKNKLTMTFTPPNKKNKAKWQFPCSMVIQSALTNIVINHNDTPFFASYRKWEPDGTNSQEHATMVISAGPYLQEFLKWLFDDAKAPVTLSDDLRLDKHESIEKAQKRKLKISRAPDADRKAREKERQQWKECLTEVDSLLQDIEKFREVDPKDGDELSSKKALDILQRFIKIGEKYPEQTEQPGWIEQAERAGDRDKAFHKRLDGLVQKEKEYQAEYAKAKKENRMIDKQDFEKKRRDERSALIEATQRNIHLGNLLRKVKTAAAGKTAEVGPRLWPSSFELKFVLPDGEPICFRVVPEGGIPQ